MERAVPTLTSEALQSTKKPLIYLTYNIVIRCNVCN